MNNLAMCVFAQVRRQFWHCPGAVLTLATHLQHDLGADGADLVQLSIRLEYALRLDIPDSEVLPWHTLADVVATLQRLPANHSPIGPAWRLAGRPVCPGEAKQKQATRE